MWWLFRDDDTPNYPLPAFFDVVKAGLAYCHKYLEPWKYSPECKTANMPDKNLFSAYSSNLRNLEDCRDWCRSLYNGAQTWLAAHVSLSEVGAYIDRYMGDRAALSKAQVRATAFVNAVSLMRVHREGRYVYERLADAHVQKHFPPSKFKAFLRQSMPAAADYEQLQKSIGMLKQRLDHLRWQTENDRRNSPEARKAREDAERAKEVERLNAEKAERERYQREEDERLARERVVAEQAQVEADRRRREAEREAEREREVQEARQRKRAANRPSWVARHKLLRCGGPEPHHFPAPLTRACPVCGDGVLEYIDASTGLAEDDFLLSHDPTAASSDDVGLPQPEELPAIERDLDLRLSIKDFPGIANFILELLLLPSQEHAPRESGLFLARRIDALVAAKFGIHEAVTYARPLRDEMLPPQLRRSWAADTFHQLVIFAHVLEPTWRTLPPPYDRLRPFYVTVAHRQADIIGRVAEARGTTDRILNSRYPDDIKRQIASLPPPPVTEDDE